MWPNMDVIWPAHEKEHNNLNYKLLNNMYSMFRLQFPGGKSVSLSDIIDRDRAQELNDDLIFGARIKTLYNKQIQMKLKRGRRDQKIILEPL
jgi:hypothetical protein